MNGKHFLQHRLESLQNYLDDFKTAPRTQKNIEYIAKETAVVQPKIDAIKQALEALTDNEIKIYEVIVEHPYSGCCEASYDKDVYRFTSKIGAEAFAEAMKKVEDFASGVHVHTEIASV